jgi:hypothetical protein
MTEEKKSTSRFELTEIATQTDVAIKDNSSGKILNTLGLLVENANTLEEIKKAVVRE